MSRFEFAAWWLLCVPAALAGAGCGSPSSPSCIPENNTVITASYTF